MISSRAVDTFDIYEYLTEQKVAEQGEKQLQTFKQFNFPQKKLKRLRNNHKLFFVITYWQNILIRI